MRIIRATTKDIPVIRKLSFEMHSHMAEQAGLKLKREALDENYTKRDFKTSEMFLALENGETVGYIQFSKRIKSDEWFGRYYELEHLAVTKTFRNRGIGKALLNIVLKKAGEKGVGVKTETPASNAGTLKFYKKKGFMPHQIIFMWRPAGR